MSDLISISSYTHYSDNYVGYGALSNVYDGNIATYIQYLSYVAIDFTINTPKIIDKIQIGVHNSTARNNLITGFVRLQASNDSTNGSNGTWVDLVTITSENFGIPASYPGFGNEISVDNIAPYVFYRLSGLARNTNSVINEWIFWGSDSEGALLEIGDLLLHGDGEAGTKTFIDSSWKGCLPIASGAVSHDDNDYKFGGSSILFSGTNGYIYIPGFGRLPDNPYTVDFWLKCPDSTSTYGIFGNYGHYSVANGYSLQRATNQYLYFKHGSNTVAQSNIIVPDNTWTHIAVVKGVDGVTKIAVNGVFDSTYTNVAFAYDVRSISKVNIGSIAYTPSTSYLKGSIDEFRINSTTALWDDDFTPPTSPYGTTELITTDFNFTEINYTPPIYNDILFWFAPVKEISLVSNNITTSFNVSYSIEAGISNVLNTEIGFYPISDRVISFLPNGINLINTGIGLEIESDSFNAYAIQNNINTGLSLGFGYDKVINIFPNLINTGISISYSKDIDMIFPINSITVSFGFTPQITASVQNTLTVSQNLSIGNKITSKFQYINYIGNVKSSHEYVNNINNLLKSEYEYILSFLTNAKNEFINSVLISTKNEFTNDINALVKSDFEFNNTLLSVVNSSNEFINTFYIKSSNEYINDISTVVKNKFEFSNNLLNSINSKNQYINSFYVKLRNEYVNDINSIVSNKFEFENNLLNVVNSQNEYLNTFYLKSDNEFINDIKTLIKSRVEYSNLLSAYAKSSNEFINTMLVSSNYEYSNGIDIVIKSINEFANHLTLMVNSEQEYVNDVLSYVPVKSTYKYINNLQDKTAIVNTNAITCYVNGQEIEVYSFDLSIDDDSYCCSFSAELNTLEDWFLCIPDANLIFTVNSVAYHLKIDSRNRTREFGDEKLQIEARSKTSILGEGHDNTITKTWDGMFVRDIISEVCSDNGIDFTYSMPNWFIQEGLLTSDAETPISLMQRLTEACGGLIVCNNLGVLNFIPKYPMCPTLYDTHVSKISDYDNIFSISETKEINNKWNSVIVSNIEDATDYSYSISEINDMEDDPYTKHIRVKVYPYLQSIDLLTSYISNDIVIVSYDNPIEEVITDEYVGIIEGQGSTSESVKSIISYQYLNQDLGTIEFDNNNLVTQTAGQSLLKITYKTEYHDFLIHSFGVERIQVYTTDENEEI